ncbi:hypothetical protein MMC25_002376 [Agyrium rufum]|nr:hypothetical protein [Agyrium rufum]
MSTLTSGEDGQIPSDPVRRRALFRALDSFRLYRKQAHFNVTHQRRQKFYALPQEHWKRLANPPFSILAKFDAVDDAIDENSKIANAILKTALKFYGLKASPTEADIDWRDCATPSDLDKARSTINQLYRDWTEAGQSEIVDICDKIFAALEEYCDPYSGHFGSRILVPGFGVGGILDSLRRSKFIVDGNETSIHQIMCYDWVRNCNNFDTPFVVHPFAYNFSNNLTVEQQTSGFSICQPEPMFGSENKRNSSKNNTISEGDFVTLYGSKAKADTYDAVVTVFFIDTAQDVMQYVETVRNCLKTGGVWINAGPLLWHHENSKSRASNTAVRDHLRSDNDHGDYREGNTGSVELTEEEVCLLVEDMGFTLKEREILGSPTGYVQNPDSMFQSLYKISYWVARKKEETAETSVTPGPQWKRKVHDTDEDDEARQAKTVKRRVSLTTSKD